MYVIYVYERSYLHCTVYCRRIYLCYYACNIIDLWISEALSSKICEALHINNDTDGILKVVEGRRLMMTSFRCLPHGVWL